MQPILIFFMGCIILLSTLQYINVLQNLDTEKEWHYEPLQAEHVNINLLEINEGPSSWGSSMAKSLLSAMVKAEPSRIEKLKKDVETVQRELWRRQELLDPAPDVSFEGEFKLYFDEKSSERLGKDDKRVIATALKQRYMEAHEVTCLCGFSRLASSKLGPVLAGIDCNCVTDIKETEPPVANVTVSSNSTNSTLPVLCAPINGTTVLNGTLPLNGTSLDSIPSINGTASSNSTVALPPCITVNSDNTTSVYIGNDTAAAV